MKIYSAILLVTWGLVVAPPGAWAWGKRGHQIVGETAAQIVSGEPDAAFMRAHSFDIGYYANVPDFIWKRPKTYDQEKAQHFMDLEIFKRAFAAKPEVKDPFALSRAEFDAQFPEIKTDAGRAYWRVREMDEALKKVTEQLKALPADSKKERQSLQEKWLMLAGPMAHYVGDLAMPLHVSENYDGQLTGQKGIHHYFEEEMVDQLYPEVATKVMAKVRAEWPRFKKTNAEKTTLQLLQDQTERSLKDVDPLLKTDKAHPRKGDLASARRFEAMIVRRLADASLVLGEIYRRRVGFKFDDDRFYFFAGEPTFIKPGTIE